jgi:hypothetical protein
MKTTKLLVAVGLVVGSFSFCNAQSKTETMKPQQEKVEITKELEQRVRDGAARASKKKVEAFDAKDASTLSSKRRAVINARELRKNKSSEPNQTTK